MIPNKHTKSKSPKQNTYTHANFALPTKASTCRASDIYELHPCPRESRTQSGNFKNQAKHKLSERFSRMEHFFKTLS